MQRVFLESGHKFVHGIGRALSAAFKKLHVMIIWNQTGSEKQVRKQLRVEERRTKETKNL